MSEVARFFAEVQDNLEGLRMDSTVRQASLDWINAQLRTRTFWTLSVAVATG